VRRLSFRWRSLAGVEVAWPDSLLIASRLSGPRFGKAVTITERGDAGIIEEMDANQTLLAEIVARILTVARPDRIILFGSAVTDRMTKDSDIDLLIVEPTPGNRHQEALRVRDAIGDIDYPVDVLIMATERFEATRNVIGGIAYPANKYGRVLYAVA
jgi:predicted nucleotidyltransferase